GLPATPLQRSPAVLGRSPSAPDGKKSPSIPDSAFDIRHEAPSLSANPPAPRIFSVPRQSKTRAAQPQNPDRSLREPPAIPTENLDEKPPQSPKAVPFPRLEGSPRPAPAREQKMFRAP